MDECSIYVAQLHESVDEDLLFELFTQAGPVKKVNIRDHRDTEAKFALIEFEHEESVLFAIEVMNGIKLFGQSLSVKPRNNTKQETLYRQQKSQIEKRNHPHSLMSSGRNSASRDSRDNRDRERNRDWERERDRRGANGGGSANRNWGGGQQQQNSYGNGQYRGGNQDRQYSTPQVLPHQHFVNHMNQNQQYSAPASYNGRWQHQPPPPPPPQQRNQNQTPHRRPDRHGFDRNGQRNDNSWRSNNGRY